MATERDPSLRGDPPRGISPARAGEVACGTVAGRRVAWVGPGAAGALEAFRSWVESDPARLADARIGGPSLGLQALEPQALEQQPLDLLAPNHRTSSGDCVAIAAGDAVVRGVPTAARVSVLGRVASRAGVTEAQVGGAFGRAFGAHLDVLVVARPAGAPRGLVRIDAGGVRFEPVPFEASAELPARGAALRGPAETALFAGAAAEAGVPFANLASVDGRPKSAPSFVGRGGLGGAFARHGLVGVVAQCGERAPFDAPGDDDPLTDVLVRSPRLLGRAADGTLELGEVRDGVDALGLVRGRRRTKHGCDGCPTPCGWTFESARGPGVGGRFSALRTALAGTVDPLEFLARCNAVGVDAGGAARVAEALGDDPIATVEALLDPSSAAFAHAAGPADDGPSRALDLVHPADRAAAVAQTVGARGPEPVRALSVFGLGGEGLAALVAPLPWTDGADPDVDAGTLARWHECFAAAVDLVGFCAFSAAALLADHVLDLDALAVALAPEGDPAAWGAGASPGRAMLGAGARHLDRHRGLGAAYGTPPPGLEPAVQAYRAAEALDPSVDGRQASATPRSVGAPVPVTVVATGFLAERLGGTDRRREFQVEAADARGAVLALAEALEPDPESGDPNRATTPPSGARRWLVSAAGHALPAVLRDGEVLVPGAPLRAGDRLELVLVIPGG